MARAACTATAKAGHRCRAFALPGEELCKVHHPEHAAAVRAARSRGAKMRAIRGRRLKLDTSAALLQFVAVLAQDVLSGRVGPDVGRVVGYLISIQRQCIESGDVAERLERLEAALAGLQQGGRRRPA